MARASGVDKQFAGATCEFPKTGHQVNLSAKTNRAVALPHPGVPVDRTHLPPSPSTLRDE